MRNKIVLIVISLAALAAVLRADPPTAEDFDFSKINRSITDAMDSVITTSDIFSKFHYVIDPEETSLSQDRYGVTLDIVGKAPWSDTNFGVSTKLIFDYISSVDTPYVEVAYDSGISIDTLAMIRHHASRCKVCELQSKTTGVLRVSMSEDCKILLRLSNVQTMDELFAIFSDHIDSSKLALDSYKSELIQAQKVLSQGVTQQSLQVQLEEVDRYISAASKVRLDKAAEGVRLSIPEIPFSGIIDVQDLVMNFSKESVNTSGQLTVHSIGGIYRAMKPEIVQMLRDLEDGESYMTYLLQIKTRFWLRVLSDHISGEIE
jgi:hypothetical protein